MFMMFNVFLRFSVFSKIKTVRLNNGFFLTISKFIQHILHTSWTVSAYIYYQLTDRIFRSSMNRNVSATIKINIRISSSFIFTQTNSFKIAEVFYDFAELSPFRKLVISSCIIHFQKNFIIELNRSPLIVRWRKKLNNAFPIFRIFFFEILFP